MTILSNRGLTSFVLFSAVNAALLLSQPGAASPLHTTTRSSLPKSRGHALRTTLGGKSREAAGRGRSCNSTLDAGFVSLQQAIDAFTTVDRKCSLNSTAGSIPNESPFSKLSPACVVGIDTILYELSNSSTAFTEAVQRCANNSNSSSGGHLTPKEEKCQNALSSITKYEFISAVEFPAIVEACDHNPNGYDCKSGVVVLILSAVKLIGLQPEMISNCIS